jgi:hypothetical protein
MTQISLGGCTPLPITDERRKLTIGGFEAKIPSQ